MYIYNKHPEDYTHIIQHRITTNTTVLVHEERTSNDKHYILQKHPVSHPLYIYTLILFIFSNFIHIIVTFTSQSKQYKYI